MVNYVTKGFSVLDCTLRDGGYYTSWDFEDYLVHGYLDAMNRLPVDFIEVGYRSGPKEEYQGAYFYLPEYLLKELRDRTHKKLSIILNEKDILPRDLDVLLKPCVDLIDLVRLAVAPENLERALVLSSVIKQLGFQVSMNLMYASRWENGFPSVEQMKKLNEVVNYFYVVDSYGGLFPGEVTKIFQHLQGHLKIGLGFHGHNNLEMALINTLTALDHGANMIDSTISGMGRGAGNLKTELLLTTLQAKHGLEVNYDQLSSVVSLFSSLKEEFRWGTNLAYMVSGANSIPQQEVMSQLSKRFYSLNSIVRGVYNKSKGIEDNLRLKDLSLSSRFKNALIVGGGPTGSSHAKGINAFIEANPDTCIIHASSKNAAAYKGLTQHQYHCLVGNEGRRLEKVFVHLEGSCKVAVLPPYPRTMGTYIPEVLKENSYQLKEITFTNKIKESVTALAIETALKLEVNNIYFVGYDGYEGKVSASEMELFQENEILFQTLNQIKHSVWSLTPTKYSNLNKASVYACL